MTRTGHRLLGFLGAVLISFIVWDQIETRALARDIAAIAARGEPTSIPDRENVELTGEQREAARWYAGAAERARDAARQDGSRIGRVDVDGVVPSDLVTLEARYPPTAPALQMLDHATPMDFKEFGSEAPELYQSASALVDLMQLNDVRADLLAARGHGDQAAKTLVASVRLLRTMPSRFSRYQASAHLLGSVRVLLRHTKPGESVLAALQRELAAYGDEDSLAREVQEMRASFLDRLESPASSPMEAVANRAMRPWRVRMARQHLAAYADALGLARTPWPERLAAGKAFEARFLSVVQQSRQRNTSSSFFRPYGPAVVAVGTNAAGLELALRRVAVTALAIERYRRAHAEAPPPSLGALVPAYLSSVPVDPFTGAALIYRTSQDGYVLYSADIDAVDSGGVLYGRGSRGQAMPRTGEPRDLGIRVELRP